MLCLVAISSIMLSHYRHVTNQKSVQSLFCPDELSCIYPQKKCDLVWLGNLATRILSACKIKMCQTDT